MPGSGCPGARIELVTLALRPCLVLQADRASAVGKHQIGGQDDRAFIGNGPQPFRHAHRQHRGASGGGVCVRLRSGKPATVGFCRAIRRDSDASDKWIATTGSGDIPLRYSANAVRGVIDFYFEPSPNVEVAAFSRVLPNAAGAEYVFTQFQVTGMSDDVFEGQVRTLIEELEVLRALISARLACPR